MKIGTFNRPFSVKKANLSSVTGVFKGAPRSFQSGINSVKVDGSRQAPDKMWPPILAAFSMTQTLNRIVEMYEN